MKDHVKGRTAKSAMRNAILDGYTEVKGVVWVKSIKPDKYGMKTYKIKYFPQ